MLQHNKFTNDSAAALLRGLFTIGRWDNEQTKSLQLLQGHKSRPGLWKSLPMQHSHMRLP
jgi:hypothetical protein